MVKDDDTPRESRKQLPTIPTPQIPTPMQPTGRVPLPSNPLLKANTNGYGPFLLEYSIMAEYALCAKQKMPGCYVIPSAMTPLVWYGMLFIRQGMYQEGVFKFTMTIPESFPDGDCPTLVFETPVFHPMVDSLTGELDVKRAFPKWRKSVNHLWQVILYARRVFYKIETKSPFNLEAANLYEQDTGQYKQKVADFIRVSKDKIYDPSKSDDPHALRVTPWIPTVHQDAKDKMLKIKGKENETRRTSTNIQPLGKGLSWMKEGSVHIFSKDSEG